MQKMQLKLDLFRIISSAFLAFSINALLNSNNSCVLSFNYLFILLYNASLAHTNVYGHITLKIPVLVRSPKSSNVERGQYLDG